MVTIDKTSSSLPKVVGAAQVNLEEASILDRNGRFTVTDVLLKLEQHSPLLQWIGGRRNDEDSVCVNQLEEADRIVVSLEQISLENTYARQFGKELGMALQRQFEVSKCIVRMSQPHIHRRNGLMFKLGDDIVEAC
jgi:hypothetical protein